MADLSDVSAALVNQVAATLYPNGTGAASAVGFGVKVYAGWPNPELLDSDLRASTPVCHVSVFPRPDERNTTRYMPQWQQVSQNTPTLTLTITGQTVTVGGTVPGSSNPHVLSVLANGKPYVYAPLVTDTLSSIATALAALIAADIAGTAAAGAVVTLPNAARLLAARVGVTGMSVREVRRQEKGWQLTIWADTPAHRDAIAVALDPVLALTTFLPMPDGTGARLLYKSSLQSDQLQKDRLYRRDMFYTVEFGTTQTEVETQVTQEQINIAAAPAGVTPYQPVSTVYF